METNITYQAYFHNRLVYDVVCLPMLAAAAGGAQGGGWPGHPGLTPDMELRVKVLPRSKLGELQGRH